MSSTPDQTDRIVTTLQASADHLTAEERQHMEDGELSGCLVQDGETALALVYEMGSGDDKPSLAETGYSPERWAIERHAARLGCMFVLWEVEGPLLDCFPDMNPA
jgi:hypothetical protein